MTIFDQDAPTEPPPPVSPASAAVRIRGVSKTYSKVRAVDNIDLDIPHGAVFGLIGPNGAGKTTTFAVLAILLAMLGLDFLTSVSAAASAIANVGPGLGPVVGPEGSYTSLPVAAKWILSAGMLLGRLELFTVMVLFTRTFWRA